MQSNWLAGDKPPRYKNIFIFFCSCVFIFLSTPVYAQSSILDLNDAIQEKKLAQQELQEQIDQYRSKISTTQKKAATLSNQISILESNIAKTKLEARTRALEAEQLKLEVQLVQAQIQEEENNVSNTLDDIAGVLRNVDRYDERKYIEILLAEQSFSKVFDQLYYTEQLGNNLKSKLDDIKNIREILKENQNLLQTKQKDAENKKQELGLLQNSLSQEKRTKEALFGKTKTSEAEFQKLLTELRASAAAIDSDIVTIEKSIRQKLDFADKLAGDTGLLSWPVPLIGALSATFHDPEYPYRYLFEHSGIDIRAKQGTAVRAAASGYVAQVKNGGFGIQPSYVMLLHGNDMATVYMHLSSFNVAPNTYVARGDIIGRSGGAPGTSGSGRWSTGPHLHFEVRLKGTPVNPTGYLP